MVLDLSNKQNYKDEKLKRINALKVLHNIGKK